ncbi:transglutaminase TgpA family protein [Permianibacter aggregans]|uniref:Uncharacterized protein DUF4129 n=1 Tax=Permianibacter aggregans TaxID=1510150 RepID=A0A4R6UMU8_9GAMM|nr:DUF3488 and transglutaminase-like domain-containing protein [Permianibacter aggregans]QGX41145.1 DUF3488 domain-containing protein [Permianibacter aggregans]TDQ44544.1 uncharacterized protein DUF4129 [Permianibacter aggregans]
MNATATTLLERPGVKALLLIAIGATLLPLWFKVPLWVAGFSALTLLSATGLGSKLPRYLLLVMVLGATAAVVVQHRGLFTKEAGLSLIVLMASFKLLELRANRDAVLLSALTFFLLFVAMLFHRDLAVNLYLFALLPVCTAAVLAMYRVDGWRGMKRLSRESGKFLLLALPIMIVAYMFFPRLAAPLWRLPGSGVTGPTDSMTIGDVQSLVLSDELAFRVKFQGTPPPESQRYWRGTVLSDFDGLTWTVGMPQAPESFEPLGPVQRQDIQMQAHRLRWLYALDVPVEVQSPIPARRVWNYTLMTNSFVREAVNYKAESYTQFRLGAELDERSQDYHLRLPAGGNPRSRDYAAQLATRFPEPKARVRAVLTEINQDEFWYTLSVPELAEDIVDDFWFNHKRGFCEHYANAVTFILRASGIPARVVVGYQGGEWNEYGQFLTLHHRDAHAWLEYWVAGEGWLRIDPTAAISPARIDQTWLDRVATRDSEFEFSDWEAFSKQAKEAPPFLVEWWTTANRWYEANIVQFNEDTQREWLKNLGLPEMSKGQLVQVLVFTLLTLMLISAIVIMRARINADPVARTYAAYCAKLARYGVMRAPGETPYALLRRAQRKLPGERAELREFVDYYVRLRYEGIGDYAGLRQRWWKLRFRRLRAV